MWWDQKDADDPVSGLKERKKSDLQVLQLVRLVYRYQVIQKLVQVAVHNGGQIVAAQPYAMIGDAVLWEVIGAYLFAAVSGLHL